MSQPSCAELSLDLHSGSGLITSATARLGIRTCLALALFALVLLSACNGRGHSSSNPTTYTIGGTVSGLTGTGLVLADNGGDNLPVTANGAFTFATPVTSGVLLPERCC